MRSVGLRGRLVSLNCNDRDNLSTRGGMSLTWAAVRRSPPLLPFHYLGTHAQCYWRCAVIWPGSAGISPSTMSVWLAPIWTMRVHGSYATSSPACTFYTLATCSWHLRPSLFQPQSLSFVQSSVSWQRVYCSTCHWFCSSCSYQRWCELHGSMFLQSHISLIVNFS